MTFHCCCYWQHLIFPCMTSAILLQELYYMIWTSKRLSIVALSIFWVLKEQLKQKDKKTTTKTKMNQWKLWIRWMKPWKSLSLALLLHFGTLYMQGRDCKAVLIHPGNGYIVDLTDISLITLIFFAMVTCNRDILLPNYLWRRCSLLG